MSNKILNFVSQRPKTVIALSFLLSFILFFTLTFPFAVLKEAIVSQINNNTPVNVQIGRMEPSFPFGISVSEVVIVPNQGGEKLKLKGVSVNVSILRLLLLSCYLDIQVENHQSQGLDVGVKFPLFRLLGSQIPSFLYLNIDQYQIEEVSNFALSMLGNDPSVNPLLSDTLRGLKFRGKLDGTIELDIEDSEMAQSSGHLNVELKDGSFEGKDLDMKTQNFTKFLVQADLAGGALKVNPNSGIISSELDVGFGGKVNLKDRIHNSQLDMEISLKLDGELQKNFGFLITAMLGGSAKGARVKMVGTLDHPRKINL